MLQIIFMYIKNKLKVILDDNNEQNITSKIQLPQFERFHDEDVYFKI